MKRAPAKKRPKDGAGKSPRKGAKPSSDPRIHFRRALSLEDQDQAAARAAYEECLRGDCSHLEARINLGRLLHLQGELQEAERVYREVSHPSAILYFNLGVLMEDLERELQAVEAYRQAILHEPGMADAHFNLSGVYERLGEAQAALRHLLAFRRLSALTE